VLLSLWPNFWEDWELFHKVTFDGLLKTITVTNSISDINIEEDIYSAWKEWLKIRDNAKWTAALRTVGGDPTVGSDALGATFFLINDWKIIIDHNINFVGNIYSDDFPSPFSVGTLDNQFLATTQVSNLIDKVIAPDLSLINIDGLTLEQTLKAVLAVLTGKMSVTVDGDGAGIDNVKFFNPAGDTAYVSGSVSGGIRVESAVITGSL
jgi:hypothetical protein